MNQIRNMFPQNTDGCQPDHVFVIRYLFIAVALKFLHVYIQSRATHHGGDRECHDCADACRGDLLHWQAFLVLAKLQDYKERVSNTSQECSSESDLVVNGT